MMMMMLVCCFFLLPPHDDRSESLEWCTIHRLGQQVCKLIGRPHPLESNFTRLHRLLNEVMSHVDMLRSLMIRTDSTAHRCG